MRKIKRLIQKSAIIFAVGTAGVTASALPIASSVVQAADIISEYNTKAKAFSDWADAQGINVELVDLGEVTVDTKKEVDEQFQNFIDAYEAAKDEVVDNTTYMYQLVIKLNPQTFTRTISLVDEDNKEIDTAVTQKVTSGDITTYTLDGAEPVQTGSIPDEKAEWEAYSPKEIEGYTIKSTENIDKKAPTADEEGKVIYQKNKEDEPGDKPGDTPGDQPGDTPSDEPGDQPGDEPGDTPGDNPGDTPGDTPGDEPGDNPGDEPGDNPGDTPGDKPGDNPGDEPGDNPGDTPGENPGGEPGDQPGVEPGENPGNEPGDTPGDEPGDITDFNINDDDDFDTALEKMKAYAESKEKEPAVEDLGEEKIETDENGYDTVKEQVEEKLSEVIQKMKEIIEKDEDPVIYTKTVSWNYEEVFYRTFSLVDENDKDISEEAGNAELVQKSTVKSAINGSTSYTEEGERSVSSTSKNDDVKFKKFEAPKVEGYEFVRSENAEEKEATKDEEGKFIYKKTAEEPGDEPGSEPGDQPGDEPGDTPSDPEPSDPEPSNPEPSDPEPSDPGDTPVDPAPIDPAPVDPTPSKPTDTPTDPVKKDPETVTAGTASKYGLSESDFKKTFTRTIRFVFDDGRKAADDVVQSVTLERTGLYDPETGNIAYGNWNSGMFGEVKVPVVAGYSPSDSVVASAPVDINSEAVDEIVTYYIADADADDFGDIVEDAIVSDSYSTDIEYLDDMPESGYEYIGNVPDTGDHSAIGGIIGAIASGIGLTGASIFGRRRKHED